MPIPSPFSTNFPLRSTPFKSRVQDNLNLNKNYFAIAFKPGFPLQASELNEIQEIFYTQQTLNNTLRTTGWTGGVPWSGATPVSKGTVTFGLTGNVVLNSGWYHVQSPSINGGVGVWAYNNSAKGITISHTETTGTPLGFKYGFIVKTTTIECPSTGTPSTTEDVSLQDQSNYNVIGGPCGAARIRLDFIRGGLTGSQGAGEVFVPIFGGPESTQSGAGTVTSRKIQFQNGDLKVV